MTYDKKFVTTSFREALKSVVSPEEIENLDEAEEIVKKPTIPSKAKKVGGRMAIAASDKATSERVKSGSYGQYKMKKSSLNSGDEVELEDDQESLTEEEIHEFLEEELGPHVEFLLSEGFTEEEIEAIVLEMLESDDE